MCGLRDRQSSWGLLIPGHSSPGILTFPRGACMKRFSLLRSKGELNPFALDDPIPGSTWDTAGGGWALSGLQGPLEFRSTGVRKH